MHKDDKRSPEVNDPKASSSLNRTAAVGTVEKEEAPPILNFRKRPDEDEPVKVTDRRGQPSEEESASSSEATPLVEVDRSAQIGTKELFHWDVTLTPRLTTTNAGIVELTSQLQRFLDAAVRGMLSDPDTPIHHPAIMGYINMHAACEQIKGVFRPQQVALSPQQIQEMQRQAKGMGKA
jgi:hypothetical protein